MLLRAITVEQAAWVLNCQPHDVPVLVSSRLLKPLGSPPAKGIKFFCTVDVLELVKDRSWLTKMTNTVNQHWHKKNAHKKCRSIYGTSKAPTGAFPLPATSTNNGAMA